MPTLQTPTVFPLAPTDGGSIADVVEHLDRQLLGTELEPEWLLAANMHEDHNEALYGPLPSRPWPAPKSWRERLAVSVHRGNSEGWIVHVDHIGYAGEPQNMTAAVQKLIVSKCLARRHASQVAEVITKMLDLA